MSKEQGSVRWFDGRLGFGFVQRQNGDDIFLHHREIISGRPSAGLIVSYEVNSGPKGLYCAQVECEPI